MLRARNKYVLLFISFYFIVLHYLIFHFFLSIINEIKNKGNNRFSPATFRWKKQIRKCDSLYAALLKGKSCLSRDKVRTKLNVLPYIILFYPVTKQHFLFLELPLIPMYMRTLSPRFNSARNHVVASIVIQMVYHLSRDDLGRMERYLLLFPYKRGSQHSNINIRQRERNNNTLLHDDCSLILLGLSNAPDLPPFALIESSPPPRRIGQRVSPSHANLVEREPRRGGVDSGEAKHVPCGFFLGERERSRPSPTIKLFRTLVSFSSRAFNHRTLVSHHRCHVLPSPCLPARHAPTNHRRARTGSPTRTDVKRDATSDGA